MNAALTTLAIAAAAACQACMSHDMPAASIGNVRRGAAAIAAAGCGSCHVIPGIRSATGKAGPPLLFWSERAFIAGELPNTPANLVRWIRDPVAVEPGTAMPALGLSETQARDIAAYLYTLH